MQLGAADYVESQYYPVQRVQCVRMRAEFVACLPTPASTIVKKQFRKRTVSRESSIDELVLAA